MRGDSHVRFQFIQRTELHGAAGAGRAVHRLTESRGTVGEDAVHAPPNSNEKQGRELGSLQSENQGRSMVGRSFRSSSLRVRTPSSAVRRPCSPRRFSICRALTKSINNLFQSSKYLIPKAHLAKLFPNLLNGIHLRGIWRNIK